jgi:hypothetical protein
VARPGEPDLRHEVGRGLPRYVERDFARYLECGVLAHRFARVRCESCSGISASNRRTPSRNVPWVEFKSRTWKPAPRRVTCRCWPEMNRSWASGHS